MPYGFQATALPVYLRQQGVSLTAIGFLGLLSLPWILKALWAPLVDRYGGYKTWILPLQLALGFTTAVSAYIPADTGTAYLLAAVFLMNLFAATQDIAVDGLAVRTLRPDELGPANAIQVVGYKVGMLTGGGLLVWLSGSFGWRIVFFGMAVLMSLVFVLTATLAENPAADGSSSERARVGEILKRLLAAAKIGGAGLLLITMTGKIGEQMIETMWKPFLVDSGFSADQIGLWQGTYGMIASIAGSLAGAWVCRKLALERALLLTAALRLPGFVLQVMLAHGKPTANAIIAVTILEHVTVGLMTTALFAFMMSKVDPRIGATHYTLLASLEVLGKAPGSLASGILAERIHYGNTFAIGAVLAAAYVAIVYFFTGRGGGTRLSRSTT